MLVGTWRADVPSAAEVAVLGSIALLADRTGVAVASAATLAHMSHMSPRSVVRSLSKLNEGGWVVSSARREGNRGRSGIHQLTARYLDLCPGWAREPGEVVTAVRVAPAPPRPPHVAGEEPWSGDVSTSAGLRTALGACQELGWDSPAGRAIEAAVVARAASAMGWVASRRSGHASREETIADCASMLWEVLRRSPAKVAAAAKPWAFATEAAVRQIAAADARAVPTVVVDGATMDQVVPTELGETFVPATDMAVSPETHVSIHDLIESASPSWRAIVDLVRGVGVEEGRAWAITCRCAEIAASAPESRRHSAARGDADLAGLGLSPDAAAAWMNLLVGTRRGGPSGSVLLRARIDPTSLKNDPVIERWLATIVGGLSSEASTNRG